MNINHGILEYCTRFSDSPCVGSQIFVVRSVWGVSVAVFRKACANRVFQKFTHIPQIMAVEMAWSFSQHVWIGCDFPQTQHQFDCCEEWISGRWQQAQNLRRTFMRGGPGTALVEWRALRQSLSKWPLFVWISPWIYLNSLIHCVVISLHLVGVKMLSSISCSNHSWDDNPNCWLFWWLETTNRSPTNLVQHGAAIEELGREFGCVPILCWCRCSSKGCRFLIHTVDLYTWNFYC